ncbi:ATP synthase subunit O, mitochondrial-like [Salmo trutta]|uniref:ATP synthase subunit O, mitochondrial-like n=1 Tax=Salmo trutta TaxID=8032 RepID=UPI0011302638|nr:ATP synthase subunit O, mitochondrial-like [Salmo trutta]
MSPISTDSKLERFQPTQCTMYTCRSGAPPDVMADNDHLTLISDIISAFSKMMSAHREEVLCTVSTTQPLDAANLKDLRVALNGFLAKGEMLKLETKVGTRNSQRRLLNS